MIKVLKASAGTGKTYRLSLEYVASLLRGDSFKEIVVMTFTRKATAEIRERIFNHIEDILTEGKESEVYASLNKIYENISLNKSSLKENYHDMLKNKDQINIYTIDSFINQIFKKAVAPYLDIYQYKIIEDSKNDDFVAEVFKRIIDNQKDFELMKKFLKDNPERDVDEYISLISKVLKNRWKFLVMNYEPRDKYDVENLSPVLDECINLLEEILIEKGKPLSENNFINDFKWIYSEYLGTDCQELKENMIRKHKKDFFKNSFWNGSKVRGKAVAALREGLEARHEEFLQLMSKYIFNEEIIPYEQQIYQFSTRIFEIYDQIKFKNKAFTHTDISNYTYKYFFQKELNLINNNKVSDYFYDILDTKIDYLFIDEFQDTSILQWKILKPLIDRCEKVIVVGDEKQSIYGWRGGEKQLFSRLENILEGKTETLNTCYRSQEKIIDFVNGFFTSIEEEWEYNKVNNLPKKDKGFVEVIVGGNGAGFNTETTSFKRKSEEKQKYLQKLNESICNNLKKRIALTINDKIDNFNNTAILARTNRDLNDIAEELDKLGIPYILESKDSLLEHKAIKPLYSLLGYLYSGDFFQLIQFLRSDLVGINNEVLKYLLNYKKMIEDYIKGEGVTESDIAFEDLAGILDEIRYLLNVEYKELIDYILNETGVLTIYQDNSGALKNIYIMYKIMKEFNSLADLMEFFEENKDSDKLKQVGVKETEAVKLLTIHKAKGLSFDTEFFYWKPGRGYSPGNNFNIYLEFDEDYQYVQDYLLIDGTWGKIFDYLDYDFVEKAKRKEKMEEINNIYVALTRAKNNLFLYVSSPRQLKDDTDKRFWNGANYELYEDAILAGTGANMLTDLIEPKSMGIFLADTESDVKENIVLPDLSDFFRAEVIPGETSREYNKNKKLDMKLSEDIKRLTGLAIHYYLEHVKYNQEAERNFARKMVINKYANILGPEKIKEIFNRVDSFIKSHSQYFSEHKEIYTEYRIEDVDKSYRIDRLIVDREQKEIIIIDFKTGELKEKAQLDKYEKLIKTKINDDYQIKSEFIEI